MKQFNFRLQSILQLRERERDAAATAYQQTVAAIEQLQQEIEKTQEEYSQQHPVQTTAASGAVNSQQLLESQRFQMHLVQRVHHLQKNIQTVKVEQERRRQLLVQCEQAVEAMLKLKNKQQLLWRETGERKANAELEEWASIRHYGKSREKNHSAGKIDN